MLSSALLVRLREGDPEAFRTLFDSHLDRVMRFMRRHSRSHAKAEDLTQALFLRIWEKRQLIDPERPIDAFLFTVYLILAEAQFRLGEMADAAITINALRTRAKATPVTAANVNLDLILDERSRELVTEEHRRYTLLRTGTWFDRTKQYNRNAGPVIALRDTILPIPQSVIDANLTKPMPQNPGY